MIGKNPQFAAAYTYIIRAQRKLGEHEESVETYEALANRGRRETHHHMMWGARCYFAASQFSKSFELFFRLLKDDYMKRDDIQHDLTSMLDQCGDLTREHAERLVEYLHTALPDADPEDASRLRDLLDAANRFLAQTDIGNQLDADPKVIVDSVGQ